MVITKIKHIVRFPEVFRKSGGRMAEWVRWQLDFGWIQRSQVRISPQSELFCIFLKILEILIKTTFRGVKNHEEHESGVKKIPSLRKTL